MGILREIKFQASLGRGEAGTGRSVVISNSIEIPEVKKVLIEHWEVMEEKLVSSQTKKMRFNRRSTMDQWAISEQGNGMMELLSDCSTI